MALSLTLIAFYGFHSLLATSKAKTFFAGLGVDSRYYRLFYNTFAGLSLLPVIWFFLQADSGLLFNRPLFLKWIGLAIWIMGILLTLLAMRQYNLNEFAGIEPLKGVVREREKLNTSGLNARVRHPLYFASIIIVWGWWLWEPSTRLTTIAGITTLYAWLGSIWEEKKLLKQYGEEYEEYQKDVPMLWPRIKK
jgi:protein-S-isoprenylcysteine O-methyltransferase Ste14